jgi:hypothetical protein
VSDTSGNGVPTYRVKHYLLSEKYLELYTSQITGSRDTRDMLYNLSLDLIDSMCRVGKKDINSLTEEHINALITIFVQDKYTNDEPKDISDESKDTTYSRLISTIGDPDLQRRLMEHLADSFSKLANTINHKKVETLSRSEKKLFRLVSHAYGHLGRMYSKGSTNYKYASQALEKALSYMRDNDPDIYHMLGVSRFNQLRDDWRLDLQSEDKKLTMDDYSAYEARVDEISGYFDSTIENGSPDYGLPYKLKLFLEYLQFAFKTRHITSNDDLKSLSPSQWHIQTLLSEALEQSKAYGELSDTAMRSIKETENKFNSNILMGDYSKAVEYFQNRVVYLKTSNSVIEREVAQRGLVMARIRYFNAMIERNHPDAKNFFHYIDQKNAEEIFQSINDLLEPNIDLTSYAERMRHSILFRYWMQFAKVLDRPVEEGLSKAKKWIELTENERYQRDPRPYYYLYVLNYLNALDGTLDGAKESNRVQRDIQRMLAEKRYSNSIYRRNHLCDLLIFEGHGMGQLFDVNYFPTSKDMLVELMNLKLTPRIMNGHLENVLYNKIGKVKLYDPVEWNDCLADIEIGVGAKNTLTEQQKTHRIAFRGGFNYEYLTGAHSNVWDLDAGESPDPWIISNSRIDFQNVTLTHEEKTAQLPNVVFAKRKPSVTFHAIRCTEKGSLQGWITSNGKYWRCTLPVNDVQDSDINTIHEINFVLIPATIDSVQGKTYILKRK